MAMFMVTLSFGFLRVRFRVRRTAGARRSADEKDRLVRDCEGEAITHCRLRLALSCFFDLLLVSGSLLFFGAFSRESSSTRRETSFRVESPIDRTRISTSRQLLQRGIVVARGRTGRADVENNGLGRIRLQKITALKGQMTD